MCMTIHSVPSQILALLSEVRALARLENPSGPPDRSSSDGQFLDDHSLEAWASIAPDYVGLPADILASIKRTRDADERRPSAEGSRRGGSR